VIRTLNWLTKHACFRALLALLIPRLGARGNSGYHVDEAIERASIHRLLVTGVACHPLRERINGFAEIFCRVHCLSFQLFLHGFFTIVVALDSNHPW
jgi:hypothetical protein